MSAEPDAGMVERVARAMCAAVWPDAPAMASNPAIVAHFAIPARAAIAALALEPPEAEHRRELLLDLPAARSGPLVDRR